MSQEEPTKDLTQLKEGEVYGAHQRRYLADGKTFVLLTPAQGAFIDFFLKGNPFPESLKQSGVSRADVERWLADKEFRDYFQHSLDQKAKAKSLNADFVKATMFEAFTGSRKVGRTEGRLLEVAYKSLCQNSLSDLLSGADTWKFEATGGKAPEEQDVASETEFIEGEAS